MLCALALNKGTCCMLFCYICVYFNSPFQSDQCRHRKPAKESIRCRRCGQFVLVELQTKTNEYAIGNLCLMGHYADDAEFKEEQVGIMSILGKERGMGSRMTRDILFGRALNRKGLNCLLSTGPFSPIKAKGTFFHHLLAPSAFSSGLQGKQMWLYMQAQLIAYIDIHL
eukprot:1146389-Pelagomonas_calceolata.AAC.5